MDYELFGMIMDKKIEKVIILPMNLTENGYTGKRTDKII